MTNLIPQLRADKNGKLVTRHVNTDQKQGAAKVIPQPKLAAKKAAPSIDSTDSMEQPSVMRAWPFGGKSKVIEALKNEFGVSSESEAEVTSNQWYAATKAGINEVQLRHFLLAGFDDVDGMVEYAREQDPKFSPRVPPGILARRHKWIDSCQSAGITRDKFLQANNNFGSYSITENILEDFDLKGDPSDVITLYADYAKSSRSVYMPYLWAGRVGLEQLKEVGVKRLRVYDPWLEGKDADEFSHIVSIIKTEEKRESPYSDVKGRVASRVYIEKRFGRERADAIREPASLGSSGHELDETFHGMTDDEAFGFAKFHDEMQQAVLSDHDAQSSDKPYLAPASKSIDYYRHGLTPEETAEAMKNGLTPESARGIKAGMKSAVAEGWL